MKEEEYLVVAGHLYRLVKASKRSPPVDPTGELCFFSGYDPASQYMITYWDASVGHRRQNVWFCNTLEELVALKKIPGPCRVYERVL